MINDIKSPDELLEYMDNIAYGFVGKNGKKYYDMYSDEWNDWSNECIVQTGEEVLESKTGTCWDQVELERYLFEKENVPFKTYFIVHYDSNKCPSHTFLIYESDGNFYWFEHSWELYRGIHVFKSELEAIRDIRDKFIKSELNGQYEPENLCIYLYNKPKYGINPLEFFKNCENGYNITSL